MKSCCWEPTQQKRSCLEEQRPKRSKKPDHHVTSEVVTMTSSARIKESHFILCVCVRSACGGPWAGLEMGWVPCLQVGAEILPLVEDLSIFRSVQEWGDDGAKDQQTDGRSVWAGKGRVRYQGDECLWSLPGSAGRGRPALHTPECPEQSSFVHPSKPSANQTFTAHHVTVLQEEAGLWGLFMYLQGVPSVVCLLIVPSETTTMSHGLDGKPVPQASSVF